MPSTPLQVQYPLSPRKFWKKMIEKTTLWLTLLFGFSVAGVIAFIFLQRPGGAGSSLSTITYSSVGMALFLVIVCIGVYALYVKAYIRRYYYDANDNFVTIKKGVFAPTEIHVQYQKIQDVYVDQDILDRIMGLYDVHIASATATSGMEAHIDGVEHEAAEGLKNLLLTRIQGGSVVGTPQSAGGAPAAAMGPVHLAEEVSSKAYPIAGTWLVQQAVTSLIMGLVWAGLVTYIAFPRRNSSVSLLDMVGLGGSRIWFLIVGVFCVASILQFVYFLIWRRTYSFEFLPEYIVMRSGVIARSEVHLPYRTVQDVVVKQGIIERLLGLATVNIQNAAAAQMVGKTLVQSGINVPGQPLDQANKLSDIVKNITLTKNPTQTGL